MPDKYLSYEKFQNPSAEYRPAPFWGINDDLDEETIRYQIDEMKDKGWGGFFTHARYGLETPYLGKEYMQCMKTAVMEAKEQGIKAWIYDEHPFPAGCAGGLATACNKEFRHKALVMRMHNRLTPIDLEEARGYFAVELDQNDVPVSCHPIDDPENYDGTEHHFMHFYLWTESCNQTHQPGFSNYDDNIIHGFPSSDNLNPDACRKFIDVTYENYKNYVGDEFGTTLMGGFSDIPCSNWNYATPHPSIPWTIGFEEYFKKEAGYDILPELPGLFYDLGNYKKVRCDYWRVSNKLFVESFTKQLYDWCEENGIQYTAHYWGEETLHWQIPWIGDCMSHFEYQHMVSMDHSIRNIEDPLGIKQAATVAEQLGKDRMASETYGMGGHNLTHKERRWIADWEYALGTNFLIPYVCLYSYRGRRKRDEPSSFFLQQAYWKYEKYMYDYYGRLSYALTVGKRKIDILLMQPLNTAWTMYTPSLDYPQAHRPDPLAFEGSTEELYAYNKIWMDISDNLLSWHRDYHVGNEAIIEGHGRAEGDQFVVGEYRYSVVVIPPSISWAPGTIQYLNEFANAGGTIIAVKPLPTMLDGEPADLVLTDQIIVVDNCGCALKDALDRCLKKDIIMDDNPDILVHHRISDDGDIFFVANTSLEKEYLDVRIGIPGDGCVEMWDCITGTRYNIPTQKVNGNTEIVLDFYPVSSYLFVRRGVSNKYPAFTRIPKQFSQIQSLSSGWDLKLGDPNALSLDFCRVKVGSSDWTDVLPVWKGHRVIKQGGIGSKYSIKYTLHVKEQIKDINCVVETPEKLKVSVNGTVLDLSEPSGTYLDPSFRLYPIAHLLHEGENTIIMEGILGIGTDVENCYLFGEFSLEKTDTCFSVVCLKKHVIGTDLTKCGFPFFTGSAYLSQNVDIHLTGKKIHLAFDKIEDTIARIFVNDELTGTVPWEPFDVDITPFVKEGENRITVELVTTRHNLFGPHHNIDGEVRKFCAPHIWTNELKWTNDYFFMPVGVTGARLCYE